MIERAYSNQQEKSKMPKEKLVHENWPKKPQYEKFVVATKMQIKTSYFHYKINKT